MNRTQRLGVIAGVGAVTLAASVAVFAADKAPGTYDQNDLTMAKGVDDWTTDAIFTVGESFGDYTPPGVLDGLGAMELDGATVRVYANHELGFGDGYEYFVPDGQGGEFGLTGARVSYFDIDKSTREVVGGGQAIQAIYDANGDQATDRSFLPPFQTGFSRLCSAGLFEAEQFGRGRGLADDIFFTGEEDGGSFNPVGGAEWALDPATGNLWSLPDLGRGAWENATVLDTGDRDTVALLLADDTSPFDADGDGTDEAAPLYLYVGTKDPSGDFPARNGLRGGKLYVWVADNGATTPLDFRGGGKLRGSWVEIDNTPVPADASLDGSTGFDQYGYPTQRTLWTRAEALGAFGFSRPEDVATNPKKGTEALLASTGVDTYAVDPATGNGADTFGTLYTVDTKFRDLSATVEIIYDGDADPTRALRSPDNVDWADDGKIYVNEDRAEFDTLTGEILFGEGAVNPNEASIVSLKPNGKDVTQIAEIDRGVVLDASVANPTTAVDNGYGDAGNWETSGILDVSALFGAKRGTLFLFDVQAHGITDQNNYPFGSRITDNDLKEGGQLLFLERN